MSIAKKVFGTTKDGTKVMLYTMKNKNGMEVSVTDLGACIVSVLAPDRNGKMADVVLGYKNVAGYEQNKPHFGGFIGRVGNRIGDARFELNGKVYELDKNNGRNNLHGGFDGYEKFMYEAECSEEEELCSVEFSRLSPDMEQGFPGNLDLTVTYSLTDDNELVLEYFAVSDKDTLCNLTNHSYFNLAGHNSGSVQKQEVLILADQYTATTDDLISTGELVDVEGTPLDFRMRKPIGRDIDQEYPALKQGGGYDQNFCVKVSGNGLDKVAELYDPESGRKMEVFSELPGLQFYSGNGINEGENCKEGAVYGKRSGVCFETQYYPNACNIDSFEGYTLKAGEEYDCATIYRFSAE
ncbi:aldose epimerase family protein [Anaerolentibacter hominis]|uniref:aldose epimerase family protein n=1 Tax=Anaerolentibacter hominis TaxID=3079009 RepID=UPI0031B87C05